MYTVNPPKYGREREKVGADERRKEKRRGRQRQNAIVIRFDTMCVISMDSPVCVFVCACVL